MPHRVSASGTRLSVSRVCKPACTLSAPVGSVLRVLLIDTWGEPS
jgi:hypothetical protein